MFTELRTEDGTVVWSGYLGKIPYVGTKIDIDGQMYRRVGACSWKLIGEVEANGSQPTVIMTVRKVAGDVLVCGPREID